MATGRTVNKWTRVYIAGYDMSGFTRAIGPLEETFDEADLTTIADAGKGFLPNQGHIKVGTLNGVFDPVTAGLHDLKTLPNERTLLIAVGIRAAPAQGDPTFNAVQQQLAYQASEEGGAIVVTLPFSEWSGEAVSRAYSRAWGVLLHALAAETVVNSAAGVDGSAATLLGGYMGYQVTAGNGTATLKVQDSADNAIWADLSGATTGVLDMTVRRGAIVAIGNTATVRQYLRWQIVFGTATSVTFSMSFVRGK